MIKLLFRSTRNEGFIVPVILMFLIALATIGTATLTLVNSNNNISEGDRYRLHAQLAADAGADASIQALNDDENWSGVAQTTIMNSNNVRTTYSATVTNDANDPLIKRITVTGRTYYPASNSSPRSERRYEVTMRGVGGGSYSVVTGVGGLYMQNSAKIVGGDVYVNGTISLQNSAQIGLTTTPVNVRAAHQSCPIPANASYPQVCGSGNGQPITIQNTAKIYGEVRATNQTTSTGMSNPGLIANSTVPALPLPSHDRAAQKAAIASTVSAASAGCSGGTKTWAANLKITGNVSISNSCKVTVLGDVWITGTLRLSNSSELKVQTGITDPPEIMIDGTSGLELSNSSKLVSNTNATPVGFRMLTYASRATCSPECADVTGTDLANGRNDVTIKIDNGSSGPNTEFYARWSAVELSNSGNVGAVVGQTVRLTNSATITFGTPVSGASAPSAWVVSSYRRLY